MTSARSVDPSLRIDFVLFNPFQAEVSEEGERFQTYQQDMMALLEQCVDEVMRVKAESPEPTPLLERLRAYLRQNPDSHLAELNRRLDELMEDFDFLVIESSDTYGAHPIFYAPEERRLITPEGATRADLIETLYGLLLIDAAFRQDKPVWGSCHGAQLGYIHAGGRLGRLFDYRRDGYDAELIKSSDYDQTPEAWHIDHTLDTNKKGTPYFEYGRAIYPLPRLFNDTPEEAGGLFLNKDFEHAFGMVAPVPEAITVISFHPLSQYRERPAEDLPKVQNAEFLKILRDQELVDAYTYRTMLGTQYHPQYTYGDLATSKVFDYLLRPWAVQEDGASSRDAE
jgi:gamma-glutamyl-gamma-aminobutyrate hydrolase PuuD